MPKSINHDELDVVGLYVCAWKLCGALLSAANFMALELTAELGPLKVALKAHRDNATKYEKEFASQYHAVRRFLRDEMPDKINSLLYLVGCFRNEVKSALEKISPEADEQTIKPRLDEIIKNCKTIVSETELLHRQLFKSSCWEMCRHCLKRMANPFKGELTVVSVDLAEYGRMVDEIEGFLGADGIFQFNRSIEAIMREALKQKSLQCEFLVNTGDGALAFLSDPNHAAEFAMAVHKAVHEKNTAKSSNHHHIHFRIGISTGAIVVKTIKTKDGRVAQHEMGGKVIATAVRLQAAAKPGQVIICDKTHSLITGRRKPKFGTRSKQFRGKAHERQLIKAWTHTVYTAPRMVTSSSTNREGSPSRRELKPTQYKGKSAGKK